MEDGAGSFLVCLTLLWDFPTSHNLPHELGGAAKKNLFSVVVPVGCADSNMPSGNGTAAPTCPTSSLFGVKI